MPFFFLPDRYYILLVIPAMLVTLWAQMRVKSTFARYSSVVLCSGLTGAQAARRILDANGLSDVRVEAVPGNLTDHYDPTQRVVRLSQDVYDRSTVAAVGMAAHETGHAVQHATGYAPLTIRNAIIPLTNIGSTISIPLVLLGFVLGWLRCQGLRPRLALSPLTAALRMRRCPAGFVYYFTGRGMHFAAFVPAGQGRFRFLNAVYGRPVVCTLDEFRRRYARLSCCFLFTVS